MSELIERQAAIDVLSLGKEMLSRVLDDIDVVGTDREKYSWGLGLIESYINDIKDLPTAQPDENAQEFIKLTARYSNGRPYYSIIYLEYDKNGVGHDIAGYSSYSLDIISDYLKKYFMPPAQPEPQWIPVSERMPEDLSEVNVTWVNHNPEPYYEFTKDKPFTTTAVYYKGEWYWLSATCVDYLGEYGRCDWDKVDKAIEIVAWMPLPEAYKPNK